VGGWVVVALAGIVFLRAVPFWITGLLGSDDAAGAASLGLPWTPVAVLLLAIGAVAVAAYLFAAGLVLWRGEGWQATLMGVALALVGFGLTDALADLRIADDQWRVAVLAVGNAANALALGVLLTFPTGQFVPRWTKALLILWSLYLALMVAIPPLDWDALDGALIVVEMSIFALGVGAQWYRHVYVSTATERTQTKWILWALLITFPAALLRDVAPVLWPQLTASGTPERFAFDVARTVYWDTAAALAAVAIAFGSVRHHLLDVDLVINRTIVTTIVAALVAGLFAGASALVNRLVLEATGQRSELADIAVAFAVAAAIAPIRRVVQRHVDRALGGFNEPVPRAAT
jgi:hypothetical protein